MRGEMIKRWKERRAQAHNSPLADPSSTVARPGTAADSSTEFSNHALPKIIEAAVVAAFGSDSFREAVASMVDPAFSKQHDKLNQLKLANLNLESLLQTRLDELPSLLQPAIDHMTSIKIPTNEKELESLTAGQHGILHLLELFGERMGGLEQQLQGFDGRMKALEEKVVNADLRSAIRFGEISNEFQDRNSTLNERLWELEREVGGKIDGQQRRIVGIGEDLGKAIRKTQEKISDLETLQSGQQDGGSTSNDELLDRIEKMAKSLSKIDAMESGLRRDIHAVSTKVSSLDTSPLDSFHRRLEAIERTISGLKDEIGTQGTLASLDSKLLSVNNARLDTIASNVTKLGFQLESVKEELSDGGTAEAHAEKLESLHLKMVELVNGFGSVQKHVGSLDTSLLSSHSESLGNLVSAIALIEGHLKQLDTTPLSSHSETLSGIKSTITEMRENIDSKLSSQAESLDAINGKILSLPETDKIDSILASLQDTHSATSKGIESLSETASKILNVTGSTQDVLVAQSKTLENTSQGLAAFRTDISDDVKPLPSKLDEIISHLYVDSENSLISTLCNMNEAHDELASIVSQQGSEINTTLAGIILAAKQSEKTQAAATKILASTLGGGIDEIRSSVGDLHESTMSELRHKNASILAEVQKSNISHAEHAARFDKAKEVADAHAKAFEDGLANLGRVGQEAHAHLESISTSLNTTKATDVAHTTALEELLNLNKKHSASLDDLHATSAQLLTAQEKSIPTTETHSSALATLQESIPKREDLEILRDHLINVLDVLEKQSAALEDVSTTKSISSLSKQLSESRDLTSAHADTVRDELKSLKSLLEAHTALGNEVSMENSKTRESVAEVLEEVKSNKALVEEHSSTTRAEGIAILEGITILKSLTESSKISSELADVKSLVQDARDNAKGADAMLHSQLQSLTDNGEKISTSLSTILNSLDSLKEQSATGPVLESIAKLKLLIDDIDVNLASVTPEILVGMKAIEHAMLSHTRSITDMNHHIQAVKDDPTTSKILSEIGTVKETATKHADALLAVNESLSAIDGKITSSQSEIGTVKETATKHADALLAVNESLGTIDGKITSNQSETSKSLKQMYTAILEDGVSRKTEGDALVAELKRLETNLATSTNELREDVKAVNALAQANGKVLGTSHDELSEVHKVVSRISADVSGMHAEHLPKLSQDIQAINLSKLNTAATTTVKALGSISTTLDELSRLSKDHGALVSSLDGKVVQGNDLTSTRITNLQTSLQSLDTTLTNSAQSATKNQKILESHNPLLESLKSSLESNTTSTSTTLSNLTTTLETISAEINTIAPAVRINSAAISRVDRAVLETGAQIKSVVLDGSSKTSREIDAALEQIDESLHDSHTRIMGISEFEIPRLEEGIKELEALVEREIDGGVREARRNGRMLGVIGARVVGTQKLFDEMVDNHAHREDGNGGGGRSLENSGVLSPGGTLGFERHGRGEHRRLGSGRWRAHSSASSGKEGSGSVGKGH
jgi:chromosome segregation ATPase